MGKLLLVAGITLLLFVAFLITAVSLPADWVAYILGKLITLFSEEPRHVYIKVVPSSNNHDYLLLVAMAILGVAFVYYGKKLKKNASK